MPIQDATILITGGAGFIGTALARRLLPHNRVRILDNFRRDALSASGLAEHPNLDLVRGDVRDRDVVQRAVEGVDYVVHMASLAGVDTVLEHPVETMEVAIEGTMNVLRACVGRSRIRRVVDFSTSEVFGSYAFRVQEADVTALGAVGEARWTYAVSKLATEHLAHNYWKQHGLPTCSIRPFNIYGPGQVGEGAIHAFVVRALAGEPIRVHNEGDQIRAWCYVDDIVEAIMQVLVHDAAVGEAFNVGNPRSAITIYQLARLIVRLTESSSPIEFVEWRFPDVELRIPDVRKAERLLGFRAKVDLEDGLSRTIDWYRRGR
ncbi:MAG: NAD-dependent epimerase/dehydratase family protein [Myxococcales bacterium]|jgi:UDP-glucose 4-epimerase|nr:NAD-dependent epimerase/dehydratase family protein [Myxococcales bacterium]